MRKHKKMKPKKNHTTTVVLSVLLGELGVDRFYLGMVGTGILKLLATLFTGLGGIIWWVIDLIWIATKTDRWQHKFTWKKK
jgi:TM2 domain-containing membrane protein YozV